MMFGIVWNNQYEIVMGFNDLLMLLWQWVVVVVVVIVVSVCVDFGILMQIVVFIGILVLLLQLCFNLSQCNMLLYDGVLIFMVVDDGMVVIENLIMIYQMNVFGQLDNSYFEIEMMFLFVYVLWCLWIFVMLKYVCVKLVVDGMCFVFGFVIVMLKIIKVDQIVEYCQMEYEGYVQGSDIFVQVLIVEQNVLNLNCVDVFWLGILINQFWIFVFLV